MIKVTTAPAHWKASRFFISILLRSTATGNETGTRSQVYSCIPTQLRWWHPRVFACWRAPSPTFKLRHNDFWKEFGCCLRGYSWCHWIDWDVLCQAGWYEQCTQVAHETPPKGKTCTQCRRLHRKAVPEPRSRKFYVAAFTLRRKKRVTGTARLANGTLLNMKFGELLMNKFVHGVSTQVALKLLTNRQLRV